MTKRTNNNYGHFENIDNTEVLGDLKHPTSIYTCSKPHPSVALHRTEKPVALMEYLVSTYSNIGDKVFDPFMGAGATGVACMKLDRWFYGSEKNEDYYNTAHDRIRKEFYATLHKYSTPMTKAFELCQEGQDNEKPYRSSRMQASQKQKKNLKKLSVL